MPIAAHSWIGSRGPRLLVTALVGVLISIGSPELAAAQEVIPRITVTPTTIAPGGALQVELANHRPGAFCVGIDGPGSNFALGFAPSAHLNLGAIVVGPDGTGRAAVTIPASLPGGDYRVIVGGCAPQPGLGPLAWDATAIVFVGPRPALTTEPHPGTTWFFAEGSTQPPFETWLHLYNPDPTDVATATITFFTATPLAPLTVTVPPLRRTSLFLNERIPPVAFGLRIDSTRPIVAERSVFFRQDGTAAVGIPALGTSWLLGEGSTQAPFHTWILILNPNPVAATVRLQFLTQDGRVVLMTRIVAPRSRESLFVNQILPEAAFATRIGSDQPIAVERSMFKISTGGGHTSPAAMVPANVWTFAEGSTQPSFETWYLIANPNPHPVRVLVRFLPQGGRPGSLLDLVVPATTRLSLFGNLATPNLAAGARIISEGGPIVVERAMYFRGGAHETIGATSLARTWLFADGSTQPPFHTWILLANPGAIGNARVSLAFGLPNGQTVTRTVIVPGEGRASLFVNQLVPNQPLTTRVDSDLPIVAERSMYLFGGQGGTNTIGTQQ